jgi:peptide/nickel transport system substrate-binding protein
MPRSSLIRRSLHATAVVIALALPVSGQAESVLRIAMTAADVPSTHGIPNNGAEGYRFLGYPVYDALVNWDFTRTESIADLTPGLATDWAADEGDRNRWIFHLRKGVKFHDGSDFNADAVAWNLARIYDDKAPQYDAPASPIVRSVVSMLTKWEKVDDYTIAVQSSSPNSYFPYLFTRMLIASPAQFAKTGSWTEFAKTPSGTGPFKIVKVTPRVGVEMVRNAEYWDAALDALLLQAQETFEPGARDKILAEAHTIVVDEAPWVYVVHDLNARALSAKVKGFKPAQSWYQDLTAISIE